MFGKEAKIYCATFSDYDQGFILSYPCPVLITVR